MTALIRDEVQATVVLDPPRIGALEAGHSVDFIIEIGPDVTPLAVNFEVQYRDILGRWGRQQFRFTDAELEVVGDAEIIANTIDDATHE